MIKWKQHCYGPGTPCKIILCSDRKGYAGELLTKYDMDDPFNSEIPRLLLSDGRFVFGYDCWWIPVAELDQPEGAMEEVKQ